MICGNLLYILVVCKGCNKNVRADKTGFCKECRTAQAGGETTNVDVQWLQDLQETNRNVGTISVGELVRIIKTVVSDRKTYRSR